MFKPVSLALAAVLTFASVPVVPAANLSDSDKGALGEAIRDYILTHPEVIEEALQSLDEKRQRAEADAASKAVSELKPLIYASSHQAVLGDPKAPITIVEFFDYNCGYCKRALADTEALLDKDKDVRFVLKEFPILSEGSVEAAIVASAVNLMAPDKYRDFHFALLGGKGQADEKRALAAAQSVGLDPAAVKARTADPDIRAGISEVYDIARKLNITGTPTYVIGDEVIPGAVGLAELDRRIDAVRSCGKATC